MLLYYTRTFLPIFTPKWQIITSIAWIINRGFEVLDGSKVTEWHALFVLTGDEDNVKERLRYRFDDKLNILVPKRKLKERKGGAWSYCVRSLFPGYVLIGGDIDLDSYYRLKNIPGLLRLLKSDRDILNIKTDGMRVLSRLICNNETIGFSDVLVENGMVRVVDGPLLSMEGVIVNIDHRKGRAKVRLNFLGDERSVELGVNVLRPVI